MENPNMAIQPDFTTEEYQEARLHLVNDAVDDQQAANILATLWVLNNNKEKLNWQTRKEQEAQRAQDEAEQAKEELAERQCRRLEEAEMARAEERKKNRTKHAPIRKVGVPSGPVNIPSLYAARKLKKGEYCELYFFTNISLAEVETFNPSIDDEALTLLKADNGQHIWVTASTTRDKSSIIKDEDLTWEQFGEASVCLISAMKEHNWEEERVDMHIDFWMAIKAHPWRRSPCMHLKRALLLYQSQQRQRWHCALSTLNTWSLSELNQELLNDACEEILDRERSQELENLRKVRNTCPSNDTPTNITLLLSAFRSPSPLLSLAL
ncbi:hypothetical protein M404DRAFT_157797 [Pisolithus tinctorius Marx 270]|uniref:Uncharacterized protein n=1 Tax=Pisolithus tinctorius Marx 270 TaxID=870435 RepID=A0A0C3IN68_PISTI|nr:hypothetical protein M404DRAFT_157797 [Pisolithus tinctorius Marx 270]